MKSTKTALRAHFPFGNVTHAVLASFYKVYNALGYGFLERVYVLALAKELRARGLGVALEVPLHVYYEGTCIGSYRADCIVESGVVVEVKTSRALSPSHRAQLLHYLRSTEMEVGLLLNFGDKPQFQRVVFSNSIKNQR